MSVEVPSEPSLQYQISTGVQYYIPGGHSDRRGRGRICTGRGREYAICFCQHLDLGIVKAHNMFAKIVELLCKNLIYLCSTNREGKGILLDHITTLVILL